MSVAHSAHFASPPYPPVPIGEHIADNGEGMGEGITDSLARLADRLAVLASAAHIMERRAPRDVYARSIAHEACVLALDTRELLARAQAGAPMRSPRIVDAAPSSSPTEAPEDAPDDPPEDAPAGEPRPYDPRIDRYTDWSTHPAFRWLDDPPPAPEDGERSTRSTRATRRDVRSSTRATDARAYARQTPPEARSKARASERATHPDARPSASLGASGADRGPDRGEMGGAQ